MKTIDFVKRVLQEAKVDLTKLGLTDFTADTDIPEEALTAYGQNLLTRERAEADPDINKVMQGRAFKAMNDGWDRDFNAYAEANLSKELAEKIKAETSTRKKWDLLREATHSGPDDKLKTSRAEIERLNKEVLERDNKLKNVVSEWEGKLTSYKKDFFLAQKIAAMNFADPYIELRDTMMDTFVRNISKKGVTLELENDALVPKRKGEHGESLDYYEANVKVGLDDLITKELGKFLKQSAGSGSGQQQPPRQPQGPIPGQKTTGLTLAEMQALEVQKKFQAAKQQQ